MLIEISDEAKIAINGIESAYSLPGTNGVHEVDVLTGVE